MMQKLQQAMDLYALKCFVNLAQTLHFGKAGDLSHLSPSALSRAIKRIEEEVGKDLFIRDNRSVSLTRAGEIFYLYAREALESYKKFHENLEAETEDIRGEVSIAVSLAGGQSVLPSIMRGFRAAYPKVNAAVKLSDDQASIDMVTRGEADIAVLLALPDYVPKGVLLAHLGETPLVFIAPVMPCEVSEAAAADPSAWGDIPMILTESDLSRRRVDAWLRGRALRPRVHAQVEKFEEVLTLVRLGCGIGVVPLCLLERTAGAWEVRVLDVRPGLVGFNVGLMTLKRRLQHPVVRAFWETAGRNGPALGAQMENT
jgi:LysR family positive regulator for ilvC